MDRMITKITEFFKIFSYWTPSRCAKILIDKAAPDPLANLFMYEKVCKFFIVIFTLKICF